MKSAFITTTLIVLAGVCFSLSLLIAHQNGMPSDPAYVVQSTPLSGDLTWYTSIPLRHAERIGNIFTARTGIRVTIVRSSTFTVRTRLFSELDTGSCIADVLTIADIGTFIELKQRGHLMTYASPHYPHYPPIYKDPDHWAVFAGFGICMAYNKNRIDTPPRQWTDLLDPRWKGRIGIEDINTAGSQYGQYYMLREILGPEFWQRLLSTQQPKVYYKTEALADALLEGEIDIAGQFSIHIAYDYKVKRSSPIEGIYPSQGIPFIVNPAAILKQAPHDREAKIFFDFLLSEEGQGLMQRLNYKYSVHTDIESIAGIPSLNDIHRLHPANGRAFANQRDAYIQEFNRFFQAKE